MEQQIESILNSFVDGITIPEIRKVYGSSEIAITRGLLKSLGAERTGEYRSKQVQKGVRYIRDGQGNIIPVPVMTSIRHCVWKMKV